MYFAKHYISNAEIKNIFINKLFLLCNLYLIDIEHTVHISFSYKNRINITIHFDIQSDASSLIRTEAEDNLVCAS
jgi:hypothetical protein